MRILWFERPGVRIDIAVHHYRKDDLSVAKAAALAGVAFDCMKEILAKRGVPLRLGSETVDEARTAVEALRKPPSSKDGTASPISITSC